MVGIYRYPDLAKLGLGYSRTTLYRLERQGLFPRRIKLNAGAPRAAVGWPRSEIHAHIRQMMNQREERIGE